MAEKDKYFSQTQLMLNVLTSVDLGDFALKGGTALNFFYEDMPRFSVDIDLTYTKLLTREDSLSKIHEGVHKIKNTLDNLGYQSVLVNSDKSNPAIKLIVFNEKSSIVIEPNSTLRGTLFPIKYKELAKSAVNTFKVAGSVPCLDKLELYAGKLNAMLDRQHPRDIFDMLIFLENNSLKDIIDPFIAYMAQGSRPFSEILAPHEIDIKNTFKTAFQGMTKRKIELDDLITTRTRIISELKASLTERHKQFLLSMMNNNPDWDLLPFDNLKELPAIKWKLLNIQKMDKKKRKAEIIKLHSAGVD